MIRIFSILIAVLFLSVGHSASAQYSDDLLKRAQDGDAEAQFALGRAYDYGEGVEQDFEEAVKWYRLAALRRLGIASRQDVRRYINNRAENSHLPFRQRERAMLGLRNR